MSGYESTPFEIGGIIADVKPSGRIYFRFNDPRFGTRDLRFYPCREPLRAINRIRVEMLNSCMCEGRDIARILDWAYVQYLRNTNKLK